MWVIFFSKFHVLTKTTSTVPCALSSGRGAYHESVYVLCAVVVAFWPAQYTIPICITRQSVTAYPNSESLFTLQNIQYQQSTALHKAIRLYSNAGNTASSTRGQHPHDSPWPHPLIPTPQCSCAMRLSADFNTGSRNRDRSLHITLHWKNTLEKQWYISSSRTPH